MSPRRPLTDSCCQKWPNQYHDVTIYHKTDNIPVTHFSTCTKSTSNKPLNTRQERWKCSTLYCLKRIRRTNNELIGNSWSKEKKMCLCVLLQNIPHENVCIGSTSMSRSSSSKIKAVYLQLRCLSTSKSWNHPAKKKNSVFKPFQCPILTYLTAQIVDIPEFIASAAIKHLCSEKAVSTVLQKYFKKKLWVLQAKRKENFLMFDSNYVSRCAVGQGLKIKVPGCGIPQQETGLQCVHSSLEGGDEHCALCFFFPPLAVRGLILWSWIMTPQVSCLLLWQCLPVAQRQNVSHVKHSRRKTNGEVGCSGDRNSLLTLTTGNC